MFIAHDDEDDEEDEEDEEIELEVSDDDEDEEAKPSLPTGAKSPKPLKKAEKLAKKSDNKRTSNDYWVSVLRQVMVLGFLEKDIENAYGVVKLTEKGQKFIEDSYPITISEDHNYENTESSDDDDISANNSSGGGAFDSALFELLKALRKKIAKEKNVPPYVVFQDPSLEEMATTYPTTSQDLAQINGVGLGKVQKFGKPFLDLIMKYVDENDIETTQDLVVKSAINKSKIKIYIIQQIDRKINLDEIVEAKDLTMTELIEEIEHICYSGTRLNLDYYINQVIDEDRQDEIYDYFMAAETDNIGAALKEFENQDATEEELRLMRIKFLSEMAN
jgi:ATP-dependent DNA helicase RecQ